MNKKQRKLITNIIIIVLIVCGLGWIVSTFVHIGGEFTDNACIEQDLVPVNARVSGFIEKIYVDEYTPVRKGDTLLTIEASEFRLHVAQAEAGLQDAKVGMQAAETGIDNASNNVAVTEANIHEVEVLLRNAEADYKRYEKLYQQQAVTQQQYDAVYTQYQALKAKAETLRRQRTGSSITLNEHQLRRDRQQAAVEVAEAALNLAKLNLSYCTVLAPCNGYTARKTVQQGELVQPGMRLFTVVDESDPRVIANFRERQYKHIAVGNKVIIKVDALPGLKLEGEVARISSATGAQYSPVAPDNSTGNFVKVEQRIPVRIHFTDRNDPETLRRLTAGMNVECKVLRK